MVTPNSGSPDWKDDPDAAGHRARPAHASRAPHTDESPTLSGDETQIDLTGTASRTAPGDAEGETRIGASLPLADDADATQLGTAPEAATAPGAFTSPGPAPGLSSIQDPELTGGGIDTIVPGGPGEGPLAPGHAFGSRYHIVSVVGVGGMGAVYKAWDQELGVLVALKVIRPEVAADPEAARALERRFKQELLLARKVTHKNVVRIHDLGEVHGIKYITMPFIEGEDLADILKREGKLPVSRVMTIARPMVSGLVAAHKAGIVHRDLKPANIMVDKDGQALIMDFGVARTAAPAGAPASAVEGVPDAMARAAVGGATVAGSVVGTIDYMAPEQARAQPVDQRADIYAVGLILYDMLLGLRRHEHAKSAIAELQQRMQTAPPAPRSISPDVPEAIDEIVTRCLQPDPAARFQTTEELEAALNRLDDEGKPLPVMRRLTRRMMVGIAVAVIALLAATYWVARGPAQPVQHEPVTVLITDFDNRTGDAAFNGTLEQTLATAVEAASFVTTFDRREARRALKGGAKLDIEGGRLVALREGIIKSLLQGSIEKQGASYAITIKAIDPGDGKELWRESQSAKSRSDVLPAMGTLGADVRERLGDKLSREQRRAAGETFTAASLEAVRNYSIAQDLALNLKFEEAAGYYKRATEEDPNFGRAYANWAMASYYLGRRDEAEQLWKKALALVDRMTEREKYRTLGIYYGQMVNNYEKAIENYETLVKLFPGDFAAHNNLAIVYFSALKFPQALAEGKKTVELHPQFVLGRSNYALFAMYAGDFDTAAKQATELVKTAPDFYNNYLPLAVAAVVKGQFDVAADAYTRMAAASPKGASLAATGMADLAMYRGRFAEAESLLRSAITADLKTKNVAGAALKQMMLAETFEATGKTRLAFRSTEAALKANNRDPSILVPAALSYIRMHRPAEAGELAATLDNQLQTQPRAWAKIIDGDIALLNKRRASAIDDFREAIKLSDFWLARYEMGVAYTEAGHYVEGLAELEACNKRRGEATALFLDDMPTLRYLAALPYWLGRAQEGVGQRAAATASFKQFLALRGTETPNDPLVIDAGKRLGT